MVVYIICIKKNTHIVIAQGHLPFNENPDVGYACLWSLKNSSYPEYVARTHSGAMCLSFHRDHGYALAVGMRDGTVVVYNVGLPTTKPQYTSDAVNDKHRACVRQVHHYRYPNVLVCFKKNRSFFIHHSHRLSLEDIFSLSSNFLFYLSISTFFFFIMK